MSTGITGMNWLRYINPIKRGRLENYVMMRCIIMAGVALAVISSIIFLIDFVEISKSLGVRTELSSLQILGLMLLKSPNVILVLLPFAFLFGTLAAFVNLNRRSELIAMRAAGMSAWRFVTPASVTAFMIGVITVTALNPLATYLSDNYERVRARIEGTAMAKEGDIYLRQGDTEGKTQTVIRAASQKSIGHLIDATFWVYNIDSTGVPSFTKRIDAREAILRPGMWDLKNAREASAGEPALFYNALSIDSNLNPQTAFEKYISAQSTPFWSLAPTIAEIERSGFSATSYRLRLHQLLATPLMFAAMSALGAVFSLRLMRLGGMAKLAIYGVSLGFAVFFFNQLCSAMGKAEVIPAFMAGWATPIIALLAAMSLLVYTEDG
jgi:lipopolysaccharide export system permease protein